METTSFDELYEFICGIGPIEGTQKIYTPEELFKIIERVRHGHRSIDFITCNYGIRDAVKRLLETDKTFLKYTNGNKAKRGRGATG